MEPSEGLAQNWAGLIVDHLIHSQTHTHSACICMPRFLQVRFGRRSNDYLQTYAGWMGRNEESIANYDAA